MNITLMNGVEYAKRLTARYAKTHKGRNALEKECIKKGYLIKRVGEIFPDVPECQKNVLGVFALDKVRGYKGGFTYIR